MRNRYALGAHSAVFRTCLIVLSGLALLGTGGCNEHDDGDGEPITELRLPTDTLLNLSCADVAIYAETCVLDDPENPFATAVIGEFDANNPEAETKFALAASLPAGPTGAKARFYLWATALARRSSGENQWYVARALHELFDASGDPIVQAQALRAYRAVLDFYFGSVTFFECCANLDPDGNPVPFSIPLNELVADDLYRTGATGWARLIPGDPLLTLSRLAEWGYTYQPATPPDYNNGVVSVNGG